MGGCIRQLGLICVLKLPSLVLRMSPTIRTMREVVSAHSPTTCALRACSSNNKLGNASPPLLSW
ncbi:hypothetical protein PF004_g9691 [Phytophthora fragariae]|uniref:Ig-like domain-containing protein n=1 Tax=Phytophthora fragariae TaxID=53985 RepID=A0A6G0P370_9STRA|nr:hypothetical protein PF003_g38468 [Phytophthora fragariae]KAE9233283.1 hypothetical protein PF004_g9691 [Phytophthora fragariae]